MLATDPALPPFAPPPDAASTGTEPAEQPVFTVDGNRLTLLDTGPRRLDALLALIGEARSSLRVLYYIYAADEAGRRGIRRLIGIGVLHDIWSSAFPGPSNPG